MNKQKPLSVHSFRLNDEVIKAIELKYPDKSIQEIIRKLLEAEAGKLACPTCGKKLK